MYWTKLRALAAAVLSVSAARILFELAHVSAQTPTRGAPSTDYNPYPSGILPADLQSEIARVQREITGIENEAIAEWHALGPVQYTGQPPKIDGNGYAAMRTLGKLMNYDQNISVLKNQACASCHMPYTGFGGPIPSVNLTMVAYPGAVHYRAGKRAPNRYTYSPNFPVFDYNANQAAFFGGNFWDGRSTGYRLQSADAEQSQHPPVDTQEMGMPDTACTTFRLSQAVYRPLFEAILGPRSFAIKWPDDVERFAVRREELARSAQITSHLS